MLTVGSLFTGIGGFDLGLERAGMRVLWQCEADPFCRRVLRKQWPAVHCYEDVRSLRSARPRKVSMLAGGFPCQPVSRVGLRRGREDERWLWPEFAHTIVLLRPGYVLVENVPGLLTHGFGDVLRDLAALGYAAEWDCIPALAVGAPHPRDRVWLVAYPDKERCSRRPGQSGPSRWDESEDCRRVFPYPGQGRHWAPADALRARRGGTEHGSHWAVEPDVGRVAHGIPGRVDRVAALGNSLVPQIAEWIGRRIIAYEEGELAA